MRALLMAGCVAAMTCLPGLLHAQPGKYSAVVVLPEIQMRAGGSWQFPPTGKLKKGEQVIVHHEDGAWVAIVPPPGTTSWVNHRFLGEFDPNGAGKQNALIMADNVEVRLGNEKGTPLGVTQIKLPRGTWVEITGAKFRDENTTWYPITPPEGEYRWLPKEALGAPNPLAPPPVFVKSGNAPPPLPTGSGKTPGSLTSAGTSTSTTIAVPQWDKAELAERAGDYALAEKLYMSIYQDLRRKNSDPELLLVCYNRIIKCQDRLRLDGSTVKLPASDGFKSPASLQPPTGTSPSTIGVAWPSEQPNKGGQRSTGPGHLRRAGFQIDGKQAYALENDRGQLLYYVTAGNGAGLDSYVNRHVEMFGVTQLRGDIRGGQYMIVSQARLVP